MMTAGYVMGLIVGFSVGVSVATLIWSRKEKK